MAKPKGKPVPDHYWREGRPPGGVEYHHEPSRLAQALWLHVISLGKAIVPPGHTHGHEPEARALLHYVRRGCFWHRQRGRDFLAQAGMVCLLDLREPVRYGSTGSKSAEIWWVYFAGKNLPALLVELAADSEPLFTGVNGVAFESGFKALLALIRQRPRGCEVRAAGWLHLLLAELFAAREADGVPDVDLVGLPRPFEELSRPVRDAIRYMARFYGEALSLKKLHSVSGLSLYHFSRLFHRETGMSPMQYFNRYRIEQAKLILQNSDRPVAMVGAMVGIPNPFKFSHLFHKLVGQTPSRFRQQAKGR